MTESIPTLITEINVKRYLQLSRELQAPHGIRDGFELKHHPSSAKDQTIWLYIKRIEPYPLMKFDPRKVPGNKIGGETKSRCC